MCQLNASSYSNHHARFGSACSRQLGGAARDSVSRSGRFRESFGRDHADPDRGHARFSRAHHTRFGRGYDSDIVNISGARGSDGARSRQRSADGRRAGVRFLRFDHGAQWHVLPLPQLRKFDGMQLTDVCSSAPRSPSWRAGRRVVERAMQRSAR